MSDADILTRMGTDAMKWAVEFNATIQEHPDIPHDVGALITWFANAIEAGRSQGRRETCPHTTPVTLADDLTACMVCGTLNPPARTPDGVRLDHAIHPRAAQCPNCGERNWRDDMGIRDCQTCGYIHQRRQV